MERPTKRFAAVLVAGVAGLAPTLAGCGQSEPTKTTNQGANASSTTEPVASTASLPESIDYNNPKELAAALSALGVETPPVEPFTPERGVVDGLAYPTWPSGDVRKAGLRTFRLDVSPSFDGKAYLKFFHGKKELYSAPFEPVKTTTIDTIPAVVVESLKAGDRVTWGVYFDKKSMKPITLDFTVTDKPATSKKVGEVDANKGLSVLGRMITKAQVLKNYSFLSEALMTYVEIVKTDDSVTSVYADMVDCLRRLKLKNTPLFQDAQMRMTTTPSPSRKGFSGGLNGGLAGGGPGSGDLPTGNQGKMAGVGPTAVAKTSGANKAGPKAGGSGLPPIPTVPGTPTPTDPSGEAAAGNQDAEHTAMMNQLRAAALTARDRADKAQRLADEAKKQADEAQAVVDSSTAKAAEYAAKAEEARAVAKDMTNGLTDEQRAFKMQQADAFERTAAEAKATADAAAEVAADAAKRAENLAQQAQLADRDADQIEQQAQDAGGGAPGVNKNLPPVLPPKVDFQVQFDAAQKAVQTAQQGLATAEKRVHDAQLALNAAQSGGTPEQINAARTELEAALANQAAAGAKLDEATQALNALNGN
jgi:hypothetical protein